MKKNEIDDLKEKLVELILDGADYEDIYKASINLDDLISEYYIEDKNIKKIS